MQKRGYIVKCLLAVVLVGMICYSQRAKAGFTGLISGTGKGFAGSWLNHNTAQSQAQTGQGIQNPSAAIPFAGYIANAPSPAGAAQSSFSHVITLPGGVLQGSYYLSSSGDGAGNPELDARVTVVPATCVALSVATSIDTNEFKANGNSGKMTVHGAGTAGTAFWVRGFEYTGDPNLIPPDDTNTVQNEAIEFLKVNGKWKFETLVLGPFDFDGNNCPLIIPFSLDSSNLDNLFFSVDATGNSVPFSIECPPDVIQTCNKAVNYPPVQVNGGCGNYTLSFSPTNGTVFPVGTNVVTVTATDDQTNTVSCGFRVIVADNKAPVPPALPDIVSSGCTGASVQKPPSPVATDNCANSVLGTTTNSFPITAFGTNIIYWKFDDGNGNITIASQRVIINGLTFLGFYSPIAGINGGCGKNQQIEAINPGSKNPIKFDIKCGNTLITSGITPQVRIDQYHGCSFVGELVVTNAVYLNDWHFNWDTTGFPADNYQIFVDLPDGTSRSVWVRVGK